VGQGALGLEIRHDDQALAKVVSALIDPVATQLVSAERAVSKALGGSCQVPIAGYATLNDSQSFTLRALVASPDGRTVIEKRHSGDLTDWDGVAGKVIEQLVADGAKELVRSAVEQFKG